MTLTRRLASRIASQHSQLRQVSSITGDTSFNACFRPFNDPSSSERYELTDPVFESKNGGLLEVVHDMDALARHSAADWKALFEERAGSNVFPYGSGVWRYKEWVVPKLANESIVSLFEGNSNLMWAPRFGQQIGVPDLWIKMCGNSHTGSFKDLGMTALVSQANAMFGAGQVQAIGCASTGDTSAALGAYCAAAGIPSVVFLPQDKISTAQLVQPIANGSAVVSMDTDFDGCMELIQQVVDQCPPGQIYLANSKNSLRIEGQKTVALEIAQQNNWEVPDFVVIPAGNCGNVYALFKGFAMLRDLGLTDRLPRLVCAQAHNANPLFQAYQRGFDSPNAFEAVQAQTTVASAIQIGNPVSYERAVMALQQTNGIVVEASEQEIMDASARGDQCGMFNCPHTGTALAGVIQLRNRGDIKESDRVVVVSTAHGLKFTDSKVAYHEDGLRNQGVVPQFANEVLKTEASVGAVLEALKTRISVGN